MDLIDRRSELYAWIRHCLVGPGSGSGTESAEFTLNDINPDERWQTGILHPILSEDQGTDPAGSALDEEDDTPGAGFEAESQLSVSSAAGSRRRYVPPSSVGYSFFIRGEALRLQVIPGAVRYETETCDPGQRRSWRRLQCGAGEADAWNLTAPLQRQLAVFRRPALDGRGELYVRWRPYAEGWIVTVSLANVQAMPPDVDRHRWHCEYSRHALFETRLDCVVDAGEVCPYPGVQYSLLCEEEQELTLQYRHHRVYAVGHGAAAEWDLAGERVQALRAEFLPRVEVPQVSAEAFGTDPELLRLDLFAGTETDVAARCEALGVFLSAYEGWVRAAAATAAGLEGEERAAALRIFARMERAAERMRGGIALLGRDPLAARAFALANHAMLRQMRQADQAVGRSPRDSYRWRPFQLAFLLLTLTSAVDEDDPDRDTLDLIWFPTGGGKTEAYLGLMAFVILWRRLKYPATCGGTTVLMRYTLRLLTKDQFRRAARLVCALELMRRTIPGLGEDSITVGLWVGQASSPNSIAEAQALLANAAESGRPPGALVLDSCPWCGEQWEVPRNYDTGPSHFYFRCTNAACDLGGSGDGRLPCNVVDAALYEAPPTLLVATIDKFARLAWEERSGAFFGKRGQRPPELIVQDELHLVASALGSVAGLYEAGLDTVLTLRGVRPKYIASTATIRTAQEQVRRLYGREAAVFPPPGLDCDDSWFARTVPVSERPGRLYVGYFAPARDRGHCLAPLAAALLSAPEALFAGVQRADREALVDAWWTLLVYHGSLKGVGISRNALQDIEQFMIRYVRERTESRSGAPDATGAEHAEGIEPRWKRLAERLAQLTSHMSPDENARTFDRLRLPWQDGEGLDLVLATNMVSVGLDVGRLAMMVVNGQPLTTAEYIQASSRVGRADVPGVVVANYYRDQARSLSHYESFRAYHESFYRFVEPTSVTPFTHQARTRALHAALVILMRHGVAGLSANQSAGDFDPARPDVAKAIEELKLRCRRAGPQRAEAVEAVEAHLDRLVGEWDDLAKRCRVQRERLVYQGSDGDRRDQRLLYAHDARVTGLWPTLHNMRNVENTAVLKVLP